MENYIQQAPTLAHAADLIADAMNAIGTENLSDIYGASISDVEECLRTTAKELIKRQLQYNLLDAINALGMRVTVKVNCGEYSGWYGVGEIYRSSLELEIIIGENWREVVPFSSVLEWRLNA